MSTIARLTWNEERKYETGVDRGVFYPKNAPGEVWNGLSSVTEDVSDSGLQRRYVDGLMIHQRRLPGFFFGEIDAYTYPKSLYEHVLTQRRTKIFGLSYRVQSGESYKIHILYNVLLQADQKIHQIREFEPWKWAFTTVPLPLFDGRRASHLVIDSSIAYSWTMTELEDVLYGTELDPPRLPLPDEVFQIFEDNSILKITDNGDGSWTATGPDGVITMTDSTTFEITWPSAVYVDAESYTISSL